MEARGIITLLDPDRLNSLVSQLGETLSIPGDVIEVGVYKGGSLRVLAEVANQLKPARDIYGFDTFGAGIPSVLPGVDGHETGDFSDNPLELVQANISPHKAILKKGTFPQDFADLLEDIRAVSFAHYDGDTYEGTTDFLEYMKRKLSIGGICVFDDYDWRNCRGVQLAIHEFLGLNPDSWVIHKRVPMQISLRRVS